MKKRIGLIIWIGVWTLLWGMIVVDFLENGSHVVGYYGPGIAMYLASLPLSFSFDLFPSAIRALFSNEIALCVYFTLVSYLFWFVIVPLVVRLFKTIWRTSHS
ncbi:MAG: hypothetical protein EAZ37_16040 [Burkholderiales bacterium]|nr:MAG: hypothetical protein EAZ43_16140 [Betaproteobacteria bacterium]TAG24513.1 MAG: hypothetical protein EAZ37_16040 [Burkholderiales bacterium]TAG45666.1 MAG: hypothetical protein EAZ30_15005 [Betaproteobacteria bacterium]